MKIISTAALRELAVINLCGGEILGYPCDFELDLDCGKIISLIIQQCDGVRIFGKKEERIIPWNKIECIGEDAILVKIEGEKCFSCSGESKRRKKAYLF